MQYRSLPGLTSYEDARALQLQLVDLRARDEIEDTVLFLEHKPVITRGKGLQFTGAERPKHMPLPLLPEGIEFAESERGGDLTYHGPGQLVVYPILKIRDLGAYLRGLETMLIELLAERGLKAESRPNAAGVWVGEKKVASMGVAVKRWVTYHGIAINIVNDLKPFHAISPCGFSPEVMGKLEDLTSISPDWRREWEAAFRKKFH
jgi:lipoate-protein ligase B